MKMTTKALGMEELEMIGGGSEAPRPGEDELELIARIYEWLFG